MQKENIFTSIINPVIKPYISFAITNCGFLAAWFLSDGNFDNFLNVGLLITPLGVISFFLQNKISINFDKKEYTTSFSIFGVDLQKQINQLNDIKHVTIDKDAGVDEFINIKIRTGGLTLTKYYLMLEFMNEEVLAVKESSSGKFLQLDAQKMALLANKDIVDKTLPKPIRIPIDKLKAAISA